MCMDVQEKHQSVASHTPATRDLAYNPSTDPDRNRHGNLSDCRLMLNPLSHTFLKTHVFIHNCGTYKVLNVQNSEESHKIFYKSQAEKLTLYIHKEELIPLSQACSRIALFQPENKETQNQNINNWRSKLKSAWDLKRFWHVWNVKFYDIQPSLNNSLIKPLTKWD